MQSDETDDGRGGRLARRVAVLGFDSVPPEILFDKLITKLPNLGRMYREGIHGRLRTCDPPITVPAWMVMMTGRNPGELGIYGFKHRRGFSYNDGYIVTSANVRARTVWDALSDAGRGSVVLGVPPGYPVKRVANAATVSCFLTPSVERPFTNPDGLRDEVIQAAGGNYIFDVTFRTENRAEVKKELFEMTEKRFDVAEHLAKTKRWDFFMMHEIGFDRLHHAFWKFFDPRHPKHVSGNEYEWIDLDYYSMVDGRVGRLLPLLGDDTVTFVLSDHGSKAMQGGFCVNQWLEQEGYLSFVKRPEAPVELDKAEIDWGRTKAWGWGGYYARIFFNVKGREAKGVVEPSELEAEKRKLADRIAEIRDHTGRRMRNSVMEPQKLYGTATGDKPDLMVYFDDLDWRSAGTVGHDSLYLFENDTGPDDSVHSMDGVIMMSVPGRDLGGREVKGARAEQVAPTIASLLGMEPRAAGFAGSTIGEALEAVRG
ncbi:MAG: alkaline phosphatase family protein [Nitrososphaerota archaeon]|nr:alkaline phosphatase family protein [Nitrososphaerota archaeon]